MQYSIKVQKVVYSS